MTDVTTLKISLVLDAADSAQLAEAKLSKNRMHMDIETPDIEGERVRLMDLGATQLSDGLCQEHGANWFLMQDPEGNEFCICDSVDGA